MRSILILCGALVLCSCTKGQPAAQQNAVKPSFEAQLRSLNEPGRNLAFRNAIQDFGYHCDRVDRSSRQEAYKTTGMWVAHCTNSGNFALFVAPSGYAQVRRCEDLKGATVPQCEPA